MRVEGAEGHPSNKKGMGRRLSECIGVVPALLYVDQTIQEALDLFHRKKIHDGIYYFYVVDRNGRLEGVVSTRALLLAMPEAKLNDVMDPAVAFLYQTQTVREALQLFSDLHLLALPVVDEHRRLLGMVDVQLYMDESVKPRNQEMRQHVFQFIGIRMEEYKVGSSWKSYSHRMPWIFCNIFSGLICAVIARFYEGVLAQILILAMFLPLVLTLCESISMQAMTQCLQILRTQNVIVSLLKRRLVLETKTVFLLAGTSAIVVGLLSYFWDGGWGPVYTIAASIFLSVIVAALIGTMIPVGLKMFRMDPKIAAGPVVLMLVDVVGTFVYLTLAYWWLYLGV